MKLQGFFFVCDKKAIQKSHPIRLAAHCPLFG